MGNNCCCTRIQLTDNNAENLIRESINQLKIRKFDFYEFDLNFQDYVSISLLDISPQDIPKWINKENYNKVLYDLILNNYEFHFQKYETFTCLSYDEILSDDRKLNLNNFLLWTISITNHPNTQKGRLEKIKLIEKVIINSDMMITYQTFKKFLFYYVNVNLYKITQNFSFCEELNYNKDLKKEFHFISFFIYNIENINDYVRNLTEKMSNKILRKSVSYNANKEMDLSNEFLKSNHLIKFFTENSFLLDILEMRDNFFNIYNEKNYNFITTDYDD